MTDRPEHPTTDAHTDPRELARMLARQVVPDALAMLEQLTHSTDPRMAKRAAALLRGYRRRQLAQLEADVHALKARRQNTEGSR